MTNTLSLLKESDIADLPPFARELVILIGFGATICLIDMRPGCPLFIPNSMCPDHPIALAIGMYAASALVKNYGGSTITLPNCKNAMVKIRHRQIRKSRADGFSQTQAALIYNLTPRQIRNIESKRMKEDSTGSLF